MNLNERIRFLASGQDDPQSVALAEAADYIERLHDAIATHPDEREAEHWALLGDAEVESRVRRGIIQLDGSPTEKQRNDSMLSRLMNPPALEWP